MLKDSKPFIFSIAIWSFEKKEHSIILDLLLCPSVAQLWKQNVPLWLQRHSKWLLNSSVSLIHWSQLLIANIIILQCVSNLRQKVVCTTMACQVRQTVFFSQLKWKIDISQTAQCDMWKLNLKRWEVNMLITLIYTEMCSKFRRFYCSTQLMCFKVASPISLYLIYIIQQIKLL